MRPVKLADRFRTIVAAPEGYRRAAGRFAARHADFDPARQCDTMLARIEEVLAGDRRRTALLV